MCGIAGAVSRNHIPDGWCAAATSALHHRGPDDSGVERVPSRQGEVALGNCRLAIQDLSPAGHMPMRDDESGSWITFNGEIYNFPELRTELERAGAQFRSHSDTEVVLQGYVRHGIAWFARLRGMFGLAIFDAKAQKLILARDRFGIKPLYYTQRGETLWFASEVRALLRSGAADRRLNPAGLYQYLTFGSVYDPETMVAGIKALPAGHVLESDGGAVKISPFHEVIDAFGTPRHDDFATAKTRVADLVRDSVRKHIISDVPVSLFLSGGIDSSVLALALNQLEVPALHSFSVVFAESDHSEAEEAALVAKLAGTTHHEIPLAQADVLRDIPEFLRAMDQPSFDGVNSWVISRAVRGAGYKVALSGLGGDEIFGGYSTFAAEPRLRHWQSISKSLGPLGVVLAAFAEVSAPTPDQRAKLTTSLRPPFADPYAVLRMMFVPQTTSRLMRNAAASAEQAMAPILASVEQARKLDAENRVSYLELTNYMRNTLLRDTDTMSMASSLEVRVPFVDPELLDYVAALPGSMKLGARPKALLKAAFADLLPPAITEKEKQGFTLPFAHWLRAELKPTLDAEFAVVPGALAEHLDPAVARSVWHDFLSGGTSWSRPWSLFVLQRWCQYNLDQSA